MSLGNEREAEGFDEGGFADTGDTGDAETHRVSGVREECVQKCVGTLAMIGTGGFEEGDGFGEGAALALEEALHQIDVRYAQFRPFDKLRVNAEDGWGRQRDGTTTTPAITTPFGLSLSKPCVIRGRPFDRLRANGEVWHRVRGRT